MMVGKGGPSILMQGKIDLTILQIANLKVPNITGPALGSSSI